MTDALRLDMQYYGQYFVDHMCHVTDTVQGLYVIEKSRNFFFGSSQNQNLVYEKVDALDE